MRDTLWTAPLGNMPPALDARKGELTWVDGCGRGEFCTRSCTLDSEDTPNEHERLTDVSFFSFCVPHCIEQVHGSFTAVSVRERTRRETGASARATGRHTDQYALG